MKKYSPYLIILLATIFLFLPFFINPPLLLQRGNDLQIVFWPVFHFIRENFWTNHQLPLWNNLFFAGTPLLPDPQFSYIYLPNIIFLLLPTSIAFFIHIFIHLFFAGVGMYLFLKKGIKISQKISIVGAIFYVFSPLFAGYLEAGHYTLITSVAWLPLLALSTYQLQKKGSFRWTLLFSLSLASILLNHTFIFLSSAFLSFLFLLFCFLTSKKRRFKSLLLAFYGVLITVGLTAITLFPQLQWSNQTTRFLLIKYPESYPFWLRWKEFLGSILSLHPQSIPTEKWLTIGILPILLAVFGFFKMNKKYRFILFLLFFLVSLLALNNLSPLYPILIDMNWYKILRVTTRLWYINVFLVTVLASYALQKSKKFTNLLIFLAILELLFYSWSYIFKPIRVNPNLAPNSVYEFLSKDKELFRVFCTTRCLSQQKNAINKIETIEGYNTLQQMNYFKHSWGLMGGYWNYYTLAIPPIGTKNLTPNAKALGEYNVKYIITPSEIIDEQLEQIEKIEGFFIYKNNIFTPRNYEIYTPNFIRVSTYNLQPITSSLVIPEVYSDGWIAYLNGNEQVHVQETPNALRAVDIKPDTHFVDFVYKPDSFKIGRLITSGTILILALIFKI